MATVESNEASKMVFSRFNATDQKLVPNFIKFNHVIYFIIKVLQKMQINNSLALSVTQISETVKQKEPFED